MKTCLLAEQEDMSSLLTARHVFSFNKKTGLVVQPADMSSCCDMSSCPFGYRLCSSENIPFGVSRGNAFECNAQGGVKYKFKVEKHNNV